MSESHFAKYGFMRALKKAVINPYIIEQELGVMKRYAGIAAKR